MRAIYYPDDITVRIDTLGGYDQPSKAENWASAKASAQNASDAYGAIVTLIHANDRNTCVALFPKTSA